MLCESFNSEHMTVFHFGLTSGIPASNANNIDVSTFHGLFVMYIKNNNNEYISQSNHIRVW